MAIERFGVVGAGIIGLTVARRLLELRPGADVTVIEKEPTAGAHQTGHNSGVIHAGLYYRPGSLKARLTKEGRELLGAFCAESGVQIVESGKVVVALTEDELAPLAEIERRSRENGVPIRRLSPSEVRELEPHAAAVAGLHSPSTAVVDYGHVVDALVDDVSRRGGTVLLGTRVTGVVRSLSQRGETLRVETTGGEHEVDRVVLCAGLQSDRVAALAGAPRDPAIVPFRGEYYRLASHAAHLVRTLIYPVPDPRYPFLGVHFTRRVGGSVDVGPNAVLALCREGYRWRDVCGADLAEMASWPGFRRLARRHWRTAIRELSGSLSHSLYLSLARRYIPELTTRDIERAGSGVRAQAVGADGTLLDDFAIQRIGPVVAVRNAPSPGATASFAIARHIVDSTGLLED